ncbi:MAG: tRNA (N6-isopentenyl adenosine(37)-C2)-methylthiotransferase MiaB [Deltaproteobacteria bacterium]|nr:MAG: tRNA (N6-isopentenyl adenosine(37)-C2)-methylthiotransferase MiaB [Deltaproteobacteria bacterium]
MKQRKHVYIQTWGCQMNELDTDRIVEILSVDGYERVWDPERADLILLNTCSVREKAEHKVYSSLGRFRRIKEERPGVIVGVSGCVAQMVGRKMLERIPYLDLVCGPGSYARLPEMVAAIEAKRHRRLCELDLGYENLMRTYDRSFAPRIVAPGKVSAYVTIMTGCDKFCTFCIVPHVRGREWSRPSAQILEEVRELAGQGVREVVLLGQTVNSYGKRPKGDLSFPALLDRIAGIEGIERIRFTSPFPKDLSDELIEVYRHNPKVCRHIHLPVQSGSDTILKRMKRQYTRRDFLERVDRLRSVAPDLAITTDFIVGFPGEREEDFEDTMSLLETVRFDASFSFSFSPRPGTPAATAPDPVPEEIANERLLRLQQRQGEITLEIERGYLGRAVEILVEGGSRRGQGQLTGRTSCNKIVNFPGDETLIGRFVSVRIEEVLPNSMRGSVVSERPETGALLVGDAVAT